MESQVKDQDEVLKVWKVESLLSAQLLLVELREKEKRNWKVNFKRWNMIKVLKFNWLEKLKYFNFYKKNTNLKLLRLIFIYFQTSLLFTSFLLLVFCWLSSSWSSFSLLVWNVHGKLSSLKNNVKKWFLMGHLNLLTTITFYPAVNQSYISFNCSWTVK